MNPWTKQLMTLGGSHKEVRALLKELQKEGGWEGRQTKNKHIQLRRYGGEVVTMSSTPSDRRSLLNARAWIARKGGPR